MLGLLEPHGPSQESGVIAETRRLLRHKGRGTRTGSDVVLWSPSAGNSGTGRRVGRKEQQFVDTDVKQTGVRPRHTSVMNFEL